MLSLFLLLPLLGIILINLPGKFNVQRTQVVACVYGIFLTIGQAAAVVFHPAGFWERADFWGKFFKLSLYVDNLTLVMLLSIAIVAFAALLAGWQSIKEPKGRINFINLMLISMIGMNGTVLLADIFSFYIFLEVTAISSFILIAFNRDIKALEGTFKYLIMSALATIMMLGSIAALMLFSDDSSFATIREAVKNNIANPIVIAAAAIFICGLFIKGGLVPFHGWLVPAYSASPSAVSILLAGIVTKAAGIYGLIRLVTTIFFPITTLNGILMFAGILAILVGAFNALKQDDFKKLLAYSSISQVGYIVLGLGCGTPLAIAGAIFHLFNHSIFKSLLFLNSASVEEQTGLRDMTKAGGLGSKMPYSNATSMIGMFSTAGLPPAAGFWSKLIIIIALWQAGNYTYASIAILASIITLGYLLSMQRRVFFGILPVNLKDTKETGIWMILPAVVLAAIILGIGLSFPLLFETFLMPVKSFFN